MTREQANQKYSELKETLDARPKGKRNQSPRKKLGNSQPIQRQRRPDALGRLLDQLITQKKINRDDARRIFEAASASRSPMPDRSNRSDGVARELREILNQARNELAGLREAREELFREHEEREHHQNEHSEHEEREHHQNEHPESEKAEHKERDHEESERAEMLRNNLELIKRAEILEEQRLQLEKAKRKVEKEQRIIETRRESEKVE